MTTQLERIEKELRLAGYDLIPITEMKSDEDYVQQIANCAFEICRIFCDQNHSGMSAEFTLKLITRLLSGDTLTPLTNNPDEWQDLTEQSYEKLYQSKRKFSCFSEDLIEYYDNDDADNYEEKVDEDGETYKALKPPSERKRVKLEEYKQES